jgi:biotin synthase
MDGMALSEADELLDTLRTKALRRQTPSRTEVLALLATGDEVILDVVAAAGRVRREFFANRVKLNHLVNMKSGLCPEDCAYCSQRRGSTTPILRYSWISPQAAADGTDLPANT